MLSLTTQNLPGYELLLLFQARFDFQYLRTNAAAKELAERHEELSLIPIGQPDAIPQKIWRKKKTHGKAVTEIG